MTSNTENGNEHIRNKETMYEWAEVILGLTIGTGLWLFWNKLL